MSIFFRSSFRSRRNLRRAWRKTGKDAKNFNCFCSVYRRLKVLSIFFRSSSRSGRNLWRAWRKTGKDAKNFNCFRSVCRRLKVLSRKFWRRPEAVEIYGERAAAEAYAKNLNCFRSVCRRLKVLSIFFRSSSRSRRNLRRAWRKTGKDAKNFSRTVLLPSQP